MSATARRIGALTALATLCAGTARLPPMTSGGSGPIIGRRAGNLPAAVQLWQPRRGAGGRRLAAAGAANQQLAAPFSLLRRALTCQDNNAGFGARAYRRNDGQWGGAMLVAAKSATPSPDNLAACAKTNWRRATAGGETAMCNSGWTTPTSYESRRGETYYILLAGTAADFCSDLNAKYKSDATGWPF